MPNLPTLPDALLAALGPAWPPILAIVQPATLVPVWATVELDRAAASIAIASRSSPVIAAPLLGARARIIGLVEAADPPEILIAEPSTEGPLAAFLARNGEAWAAVYLRADPAALERLGATAAMVSSPSDGPYGPERLLLGGPRSGPFVILAGAG
jgi:hypothetical protein